MNFEQIIKTIYQKKWLIFWLTLLGAVLAFNLAVIQKPQYRANSKILIVQKQNAGQDIYTISKSAQYLTRILKEGIYSDSFLDRIIESPYNIEENDFPSQLKERRKQWTKNTKVRILRDLGVMEIDVFHPQKDKAENINRAITIVLKENHQIYHGGGENVIVKVLDNPLVSQKPIKPNLWLNLIIGAIIGFLAGLGWILFQKQSIKKTDEIFPLDRKELSV